MISNESATSLELWADDLAVEELPAVNSASWLFMSWACLPFQCLTTVVAPAFVNQVVLGY
jgi:hypothetical protein